MRKTSATKRKNDVIRAQVLRVRVARLICCFESSAVGTSVAGVAAVTTVSSDARRRLKKRMLSVKRSVNNGQSEGRNE